MHCKLEALAGMADACSSLDSTTRRSMRPSPITSGERQHRLHEPQHRRSLLVLLQERRRQC
ncbi:unnamed protein product [Urochloa humidicola]